MATEADRTDPMAALRETVQIMVGHGGCAWHGVQTHESLIPFLIEEAAEFIDAVERELPSTLVGEELGDVLYQVVFHAALAERDGEGYDLDAIAQALNDKLRARHPHVFGDRGYMSVEELNAEWERLKEDAAGKARGSRAPLEGIPLGMPTLARAGKVIERLKRAGLLPPAGTETSVRDEPARDKQVRGEPARDKQVRGESARDESARGEAVFDETVLGDALLELVGRANAAGLDADRALRLATNRLADRLTSAGSSGSSCSG